MHIGFITPEYPNDRLSKVGGLGTSLKNLAVSLMQEHISLTLFVVGQKFNEIFYDEGIEIHALKNKTFPIAQWYFNRKAINGYINKVVLEKNIDLLEAPDWTGITAFMNFKCPLVIRFHGSDTYFCKLDKRKQKFKNYIIEKSAVKKADGFIAPTTFAGELSRQLFKIKGKTIKVIHYGLFLEKFKNKHPSEFNAGTILYLGTLVRKKGVFELVKIFNEVAEKMPNTSLVLIGNDSSDQLTGASSTWELMKSGFSKTALERVAYKGKVEYGKVQEHIRSANVCVFPTFAETLGMVTIESMALQKPVVNSNYGWALELIDDGVNGFLVDPEDTNKYASRVIQILEDKTLALQLGKAASEKVENTFDIRKLVHENIAFYKSLI